MYLFRKYGYELYNGNENGKDNAGDRQFLMSDNINGEKLTNLTIEYLTSKYNPTEISEYEYKNINNKENWKIFIEAADKELNENIFKPRFNKTMEEFYNLSDSEIKDIWKKRLNTYIQDNNEDDSSILINSKNYPQECNKLLMKKLSVEDLEKCGLKKIKIEEFCEMIEDGKFNNLIFSKFGNYLSQSPITILKSKSYDIRNNKLKDLGLDINPKYADEGICFWAIKKLNETTVQKFFSNADSGKESRYIIMPYTSSMKYKINKNKFLEGIRNINLLNPGFNEDFNNFFDRMKNNKELAENNFASGYTSKCNETRKKKNFSYPDKMFPAVIMKKSKKSKSNSNALLISEFSFIEESYNDFSEIYKYFNSMIKGKTPEELAFTFGVKGAKSIIPTKENGVEYYKESNGTSSVSHICAVLKDGKAQELINYLKNNFEKKPDFKTTSFLIAKIEYPYIVKLIN